MKKKVLLSSILTIALCLCLIAGSTFALFTSQTQVDITVKAARVKMEASVSELKLYSVKATANGTIVDEFGGKYEYVDRTADQTFANGGTATFDTGVLTLDRITPGDKVSFDVTGANTSDVTIQYRYKVECISGELLMSGLLVTIEGVTYPILDSYTSVWNTLTPGTDITPEPIVIEFPVTAGNDYQEQNVEIRVTVEAVQGNADVKGTKPVVEFLDGYTGDLGGQTLTDAVKNYGTVGLTNGTIVLDNVGFENYGNATLTDVTIDGGTPGTIAYGYGIIGQANSVTVLNDVDLTSANGGIGVVDGGELTFNSGRLQVYSKNTSGRYMFYVVGEGSVATINGGNFIGFDEIPAGQSGVQNQKRAYAYVGAGATLYINGGTFGKASTRSGYTAGLLGDGTIIITGGTFGFNPSKWVADGYKATKVGAQWIVTDEDTYIAPVVGDSEGTTYEGELFSNLTDALIFQNATLKDTATVTVKRTYKTVVLEDVVASVNGDLIICEMDNTVILHNCDITIPEGAKLITTTDGTTVGQVMMHNVTVNGVLLTQQTAAQYLDGVNWYQVW